MMQKRCSTCKTVKATDEFYRNRGTKDGLDNVCKSCRREHNKKFRQKHPDYDKHYKRRMRAAKKDGSWEPREYRTGDDPITITNARQSGVQTPQRGR